MCLYVYTFLVIIYFFISLSNRHVYLSVYLSLWWKTKICMSVYLVVFHFLFSFCIPLNVQCSNLFYLSVFFSFNVWSSNVNLIWSETTDTSADLLTLFEFFWFLTFFQIFCSTCLSRFCVARTRQPISNHPR